MIVQVWRRAQEADIGPVVVACAEQAIFEAVCDFGGEAVITDPDHPSGSDRIHEALGTVDSGGEFDAIVNIQGDLPTIDALTVRKVLDPFDAAACDITTLVTKIINLIQQRISFKPLLEKRPEKFYHRLCIAGGSMSQSSIQGRT